MTAIHWTDDDRGYEEWIATHPSGFVANTNNPPKAAYFRIHRASHNLPDRSNPESVNPRTGRQYSKVTANSIVELIEWATRHMPEFGTSGNASYCKTCVPTEDAGPETNPTASFEEYIVKADRLLARGPVDKPPGVVKPATVQCNTTVFYRDPKVRAWILQRAAGQCELCTAQAPFLTTDEKPYLESHHLTMLSEGGPDTPNNTAALCPNCHRRLHYGIGREELKNRLTDHLASREAVLAKRGADG